MYKNEFVIQTPPLLFLGGRNLYFEYAVSGSQLHTANSEKLKCVKTNSTSPEIN